MRTPGATVVRGRWGRSLSGGSLSESFSVDGVAVFLCCTTLGRTVSTFKCGRCRCRMARPVVSMHLATSADMCSRPTTKLALKPNARRKAAWFLVAVCAIGITSSGSAMTRTWRPLCPRLAAPGQRHHPTRRAVVLDLSPSGLNTPYVDFVTGVFATWLLEQLADVGRSGLFRFIRGDKQDDALRRAADAAIKLTAADFLQGEATEQLAVSIDQVFGGDVLDRTISKYPTILQTLQAEVTTRVAVLGDPDLTGIGASSADLFGVSSTAVGQHLVSHLIAEIKKRGSRGGPLKPLADQLNFDESREQVRRMDSKLIELDAKLETARRDQRRKASKSHETLNRSEVIQTGYSRAASLLPEALRSAYSIDYSMAQAVALTSIAAWVQVHDPDRARRLFADAERIARSAIPEDVKAMTLAKVAKALRNDPVRAKKLIAEAEHIAASLDDWEKATATLSIADAVAVMDPDRAERLAHTIPEQSVRIVALDTIAKALADADLSRAERVARSISDQESKDMALAELVPAVVAMDPDRAERLAQEITDTYSKVSALASISMHLAFSDPDRAGRLITDAERLAATIAAQHWLALAMAVVAWPLAFIDPNRAAQLINDTHRLSRSIMDDGGWALPLVRITEAMAIFDPRRAERAARSINNKYDRSQALAGVSRVIAVTDPDHAERVARLITDKDMRAHALLQLMTAWDQPQQGLAEKGDGDSVSPCL